MIVNGKELKRAIGIIGKVITKDSMPVLRCLRFTQKGSVLTVSGTNDRVFVAVDLMTSTKGSFDFLVDYYDLKSIKFETETEINLVGDTYNIGCVSGKIQNMLKELPLSGKVENPESFCLELNKNKNKLISFASGTRYDEYCYQGVCFNKRKEKLDIVSSDGTCLSLCQVETTLPEGFKVFLPHFVFDILDKALSKNDSIVNFLAGEKHSKITCDNVTIITQNIGNSFPDYWRVLPNEKPKSTLTFSTKPVTDFIKTVKTGYSIEQVDLALSGNELTVSAESQSGGTVKKTFPATGENFTSIGINKDVVLPCLKLLPETTTIYQGDPRKVHCIYSDNFTFAFMPIAKEEEEEYEEIEPEVEGPENPPETATSDKTEPSEGNTTAEVEKTQGDEPEAENLPVPLAIEHKPAEITGTPAEVIFTLLSGGYKRMVTPEKQVKPLSFKSVTGTIKAVYNWYKGFHCYELNSDNEYLGRAFIPQD